MAKYNYEITPWHLLSVHMYIHAWLIGELFALMKVSGMAEIVAVNPNTSDECHADNVIFT